MSCPNSGLVTSRGRGKLHGDLGHHTTGPRREHGDPVGEKGGLLHVVGHQQHGARLVGERVRKPALHRRARERVEAPEGLVEEEHGAAGQERAQEGHALAHPAGQLGRAGALELREAEALEQRLGAAARLGARHALALQRERGVREGVPPREQEVALRHVGARGPAPRGVGGAQQGHAAGVRLLEAGHELQQRGLAAARRTDNGHQLVLPDGQVDSLEGGDPGVPPRHVPERKRLRHRSLDLSLHRSLRGHYPTGSKGQRRGPWRYLSPLPRAPLACAASLSRRRRAVRPARSRTPRAAWWSSTRRRRRRRARRPTSRNRRSSSRAAAPG